MDYHYLCHHHHFSHTAVFLFELFRCGDLRVERELPEAARRGAFGALAARCAHEARVQGVAAGRLETLVRGPKGDVRKGFKQMKGSAMMHRCMVLWIR